MNANIVKPIIIIFYAYNILEIILYLIYPIESKNKNFFSDLIAFGAAAFYFLRVFKEKYIFFILILMSITLLIKDIGFFIYEKEKIYKLKAFPFFVITAVATIALVFGLIFA